MTINSTQLGTLVQHFRTYKNISSLEANHIYRIRSLSSRICELEKMGVTFMRQRKTDPTGRAYIRYHVISLADFSPKRRGYLANQYAMELAA